MYIIIIIKHHLDPTINITISPSSEGIHDIGVKFNMTCTVSGLDHLNPGLSYQWTNGSILTTDSTIMFASLTLPDAGEYTCKVNASSRNFVSGFVMGTKNYSLYMRSKQSDFCQLELTIVPLLLQSPNHHQYC